MNRTILLTVLLTSIYLALGHSLTFGRDESKEPQLGFVVKVGDKSIALAEGETAQLAGAFTDPKISVTVQAYRVFNYQGITFRYPRSFAFGADLVDPEAKTWSLSGNDLTIMCMVLNYEVSTGDIAQTLIEQVGRRNGKVTDANAKITLGGKALTGTTIQLSVAGQKMVTEIYQLPSNGPGTKLLVFQDCLDDEGNRSNEKADTVKEIDASLVIQE